MDMGIIGAGRLGQAMARTALRAGRQVVLANSRGPGSLSSVIAALGEPPRPVCLDEDVLIPKRGGHHPALAVVRVHVVREAVGLPRRTAPVERHRALPVEVHRDLVRVQVVEHGRQRIAAMQIVGRVGALAGHVDDEGGCPR